MSFSDNNPSVDPGSYNTGFQNTASRANVDLNNSQAENNAQAAEGANNLKNAAINSEVCITTLSWCSLDLC